MHRGETKLSASEVLKTPNTWEKEKKTCLRRPVAALESSNEQLPTSSPPAHNTFSQQHNRTHITHNDSIRKEESPTAEKPYQLQPSIYVAVFPSFYSSVHLFYCLSVHPFTHQSIHMAVCLSKPSLPKIQYNFNTVFYYFLVYYCIISLSVCLWTICQSICLSIHQSVISIDPSICLSIHLSVFLSIHLSVHCYLSDCVIWPWWDLG